MRTKLALCLVALAGAGLPAGCAGPAPAPPGTPTAAATMIQREAGTGVVPTNTVIGLHPAPVLGLVVAPDLTVAAVAPGSGAAEAGIQPGDRLLALDGVALTGTAQGQQVAQAAILSGDHAVQVRLRRNGQERTIAVLPGPPPTFGTFQAPAVVTPTPLPPGFGYY
jgi:S1-C subfamily serine protease